MLGDWLNGQLLRYKMKNDNAHPIAKLMVTIKGLQDIVADMAMKMHVGGNIKDKMAAEKIRKIVDIANEAADMIWEEE